MCIRDRRGAFARQMLIWDEVIYSDGLLGMLYSRLIESVSMQGWKIDAADDSQMCIRDRAETRQCRGNPDKIND